MKDLNLPPGMKPDDSAKGGVGAANALAKQGMKPLHVVEAALFSAGRAVTVEEVMEATGLKRAAVERACNELAALYRERDTTLEVGKAGKGWAMQVRTVAAEPAARFARMEIPPKTLKTLALIAYHQPIKQSELCDMIGSKVYDHIPALKDLGLVKTRRDGQTKVLSVTSRFPEYFGLDAATPDEIRALMAKLVGMDPASARRAKRKKEKDLGSFRDAGSPPAPEGDAEPAEAPEAAEAAEATLPS